MGKIESKKKQKKNALLQTAFELFTDKGFAKTTISDIVDHAGLAKGTFYLYFKDKYDLRNKLTAYKAGQLFSKAHKSILEHPVTGLENQIIYFADFFIDSFEKDHALLQFISKNLSWGIFRTAFEQPVPEESQQFYDYFMEIIKKGSVSCEEPELMLFTIIELVGSTCYNCILFGQPMSMDKYKPFLHETIHRIVEQYTQPPKNQEGLSL
ncbi:MAG: TetR/AcrR family transcriptional regulator [Lachnospiraceae bacterium]|nr:TetR/AcrR family transcriptional regulator [Lachnospiraceae bacterium]